MTTIVTRAGKGSPLTHTEVDTNFTNLNTAKLETAAIPLGTAAAPSVSFLSDANTGIYSPGADQVAVATNGTQRLLINSGGITSANGGVFSGDVTSYGVQGLALTFNSNNSEIRACRSGGNYSSLLFFTPGANSSGVQAERVRITSEGLVGIGASSPNTALDVNGTINVRTNSFQFGRITTNNVSGDVGGLTFQYNNAGTFTNGIVLNGGGNVGIGTTGPQGKLESAAGDSTSYSIVANNSYSTGDQNYISLTASTTQIGSINRVTNDIAIKSNYDGIVFWTGTGGTATQKAKIDSDGRLLVGTSTARSIATQSLAIQNEGTSFGTTGFSTCRNSNDIYGPYIHFGKTRGASVGSNTLVSSGDDLGGLIFGGGDGTDVDSQAAYIVCQVDGTPGANDMPGRLVFSTTADGASSPTERMRIGSEGNIYINKGSTSFGTAGTVLYGGSTANGAIDLTRSAAYSIAINRLTTDGNLIEFYRDTALQGTISVSGATVSYNGAHLSRWSQLPSGAERTEILRGSVLSNLDEMCEWSDEENEQLNRMKVSDVEGDKNVSGVFQAWDDDDDTYINDFYCAMTGDFIIRIAEGVTVERGDLLMSAGDGTAKPQDDDIIRSKTIAKVTSTNVSCTYDDGSYCVPCVLMAC